MSNKTGQYYREDQIVKTARKIYELLKKTEVNVCEFNRIFRLVRKDVLENAELKKEGVRRN